MTSGHDLKEKFWDALDDSPFVMLGLAGVDEAHTQPMTAQFDDDIPNEIFFFTGKDNRLVRALTASHRAVFAFSAKGHDLFASVHGTLREDTDPALIDKFWSPVVSAWFKDGKEDRNLALLRFELGAGEIWQAGTGEFLHYMASALVRGSAQEAAREDVAKVHF